MKKIIFLFLMILAFIGLTMSVYAQTPIATKNIGVDSITGLNQRVNVWQLSIDAKAETVVVIYNIETLAPNGVVVATGQNLIYVRTNKEGDMRFNALRVSQVGQMISGMIAQDLNNYPNLSQ